jgi:hypothetical protein
VGNPSFSFSVPYYGFYVQDTFRALPKLTLEMGLREDFQVYPQPAENPLLSRSPGNIPISLNASPRASDSPGSRIERRSSAEDSVSSIPT